MQLSQKQKSFSPFLGAFFKSKLNFKYFEKKITLRDFVFPKLLIIQMYKNSRLRGPLEKKHGKRAEPLSKSASQHVHHIH